MLQELSLKYDKRLTGIYFVSVCSVLLVFYALSPFRLWAMFSFLNQIEALVVISSLSLVCCIGLLTGYFTKLNHAISINTLDIILFVYLLFLLLQLMFFAVDKEYIFKIICLTAVYFTFRKIPFRLLTLSLYLLPVLAIIQLIYGYNHLTEAWQGLSDIKGIFYNTGIFGGFVALGLVSAFSLIFLFKPQKYYLDKIALLLLAIPLGIQLIYSWSRAAWLSVIAAIIILFLSFLKLSKPKTAILISILCIIGMLFFTKLYHLKKNSADGRLLIWTVSWNLSKEKPLTGFGPNGFSKNYIFRQGDYLKNHPNSSWAVLADDIREPNNEFIKIAVEQGIIGLLFISGILFSAFSGKNRKELDGEEYGTLKTAQVILAALLVFACFSFPFFYIQFQVLLMICLAIIARSKKSFTFSISGIIRKGTTSMAIICCGIAIGSLHHYTSLTVRWEKAIKNIYNDEDKSFDEFQKLYPAMKHNAVFMETYGWRLLQAGRYSDLALCMEKTIALRPSANTFMLLGEAYDKTGRYSEAIEAYQQAAYIIPSLFKPHYNMAKLYFEQQDYVRAKEKAKEIVNKKIKIDTPKIDRMKKEMQSILDYNSE